ncbi:50S ribosomal protein L13 [Chlamydiales bacterium SCGC AB-751-O23]|jgi:large subunit ribosomal protein L13|nr:50S ribosomal protein L13 [Chlamydiales bacterium SCGC AB-751-O23]
MPKEKSLKVPRTHQAKVKEKTLRWFLIDADGKTLGRLSSEIAKILRGKHRPDFTPNADTGDAVVVINCEKIVVSGNKEAQKVYRHYTGYMSGLREITYQTMMEKHPDRIMSHAVKGMLPKTKLGRAQFKRLRVLAGSEHKMQAQQPITVNV